MGLFKKLNPLSNTNLMIIIDDYLNQSHFWKLRNYLMSPSARWQYNNHKVVKTEPTDSFQFVHTFYRILQPRVRKKAIHNDLTYIEPLLKKLNPTLLLKAKANITPRTPEPDKTLLHTDFGEKMKHKTAIYYVNTNNGYTEFESGQIVESVENRIVIFDADQYHRGVSCTDEKVRVVLNLNFFP